MKDRARRYDALFLLCVKGSVEMEREINILVACEESQRVCQAFRDKGFSAFSCDILPSGGGFPQWHIQGDVVPLLNGNCEFETEDGTRHILTGKWDAIIAFPPCTHLATSGGLYFEQKRADGRQRQAIEFFGMILNADCNNILIENPVGIMGGKYIKKYFPDLCEQYGLSVKPSQIIQPWMFGDDYTKTTCVWIKGFPKLIPYVTEKPEDCPSYANIVLHDENGKAIGFHTDLCKRLRSKTFLGIANAISDQYGEYLLNIKNQEVILC